MSKVYMFHTQSKPAIEEVGGKADSLIKLTAGNFNVPKGAVLSVSFFRDWIDRLNDKQKVSGLQGDSSKFRELSLMLKGEAEKLLYSEEQKAHMASVLKEFHKDTLFAVRSSSPEEDLSGASFAGGYETVLGVKRDDIEEAVRKAFISCLDERVFYYKEQNGFDPAQIRIAVIIQEQIASESSGVGFSINPLNNCYDEAVINANTGLGESVVSGLITPDEYIVDKKDFHTLQCQVGSKEKSIILSKDGGTEIVPGTGENKVLNEGQIRDLTAQIVQIEKFYGHPVDTEWAFSRGTLYILQARPVTAYIPLPAELQTEPGEQKVLYIDGSLTKQGITTPISPLGCDAITLTQKVMFNDIFGKDVCALPKEGIAWTSGGRMYVNYSSMGKLQGFKRLSSLWRTADVATSDMLDTLDTGPYEPAKLPGLLKGAMWGAIKNNIGTVKFMRQAMKDPAAYKEWYQPYEDEFDSWLRGLDKKDLSLADAPESIISRYIDLLGKMLPMTYAAETTRKAIGKQLEKLFDDGRERMQYLERSLPDNVTVDMGLKMYELSRFSEIRDNEYRDFKELLTEGKLSPQFSAEWNRYLAQYGCRVTNEMDIAVEKPSENPEDLFRQIKSMSQIPEDNSPVELHRKSEELREKTLEELADRLSGSAKAKLMKRYNVLVSLGGKREALKYWYIRSLTAIRELVLIKADELVASGKLKERNDIFKMDFYTAVKAHELSAEEIESKISEITVYYDKLKMVRNFPKLIDSRGKILTMPAAEAGEGEVAGQAISPGVIRGRVKVLATPDEKPLNPGEILVTKATDPGWTPLFINASAIILEVGGLLQHGSLVAREYGKACVAGVDDAMNLFEDGQLIEVDGSTGRIRILEEDRETA